MSERNTNIGQEESLNREYLVLMDRATEKIVKLLKNQSLLSEKAESRQDELYHRINNISQIWKATMAKSEPGRTKIDTYNEIISMLNEVLDDIKNFESKKDSL